MALFVGLAGSSAEAACKFAKVAELPVIIDNLRAVADVKINGKDAKLMIDSGAFFSNVTDEAAQAYAMKSTPAPFGLAVVGIGGSRRDARAVKADQFALAGSVFRNIEFLVGGRVGGAGSAGLIGENILGPFDTEYDLGNGVIRFFKAEGCGADANLAYWSQGKSLSRIPLDVPGRYLTHISAKAQIDGRSVRVVLDTGVRLSILSRSAAARAGVQISNEGVTPAGLSYGIYGQSAEEFLAPFASFKIGDEEIKNTRLRFADLRLEGTDMLLGMDFFLSHRILASSSQHQLYFTYNGGPVFRMDQAPLRQPQPATQVAVAPGTAVATASVPIDTGETPKTAAEFARRASAFVGRRDFAHAIEDLTQAIGLEPENATYYRARAMARLGARQPVLAMADLDETLKRKPDDPEALMRRGELYLSTRDPARAKVDFDAAMKLEPQNGDLIVRAANAYSRAGLYEPAIHELDVWLAAHPKGDDSGNIVLARCYARAAWGKELDAALADCDASLRRDRNSVALRTRGLVLLRLGRSDDAISQFAAAIKAQPRDAAALFGRGLAELNKGQKTEADADFAAARAVAPQIANEFKRMGLVAGGATPAPAAL
jgi:tetratricopeptide (TPR) repeat protein